MKKDAVIEIKGIARQSGEEDVLELTTKGFFYKKDNNFYITYDESEAMGFEGVKTTLKVEGDRRVTMTRRGKMDALLLMERGVRHSCHYGTEYGEMNMGVFTDRIVTQLDENGGKLEFSYSLDVNASLASENQVFIQVRTCK